MNVSQMIKELEKLGFTVLPSHTNFIFAKHENISGEEMYEKLLQERKQAQSQAKQYLKQKNDDDDDDSGANWGDDDD